MKARYSSTELVCIFALGFAMYLGVIASVWWVWGAVMGSLWPEGPENLIDPPYLVFVGVALLVSWGASLLRVDK